MFAIIFLLAFTTAFVLKGGSYTVSPSECGSSSYFDEDAQYCICYDETKIFMPPQLSYEGCVTPDRGCQILVPNTHYDPSDPQNTCPCNTGFTYVQNGANNGLGECISNGGATDNSCPSNSYWNGNKCECSSGYKEDSGRCYTYSDYCLFFYGSNYIWDYSRNECKVYNPSTENSCPQGQHYSEYDHRCICDVGELAEDINGNSFCYTTKDEMCSKLIPNSFYNEDAATDNGYPCKCKDGYTSEYSTYQGMKFLSQCITSYSNSCPTGQYWDTNNNQCMCSKGYTSQDYDGKVICFETLDDNCNYFLPNSKYQASGNTCVCKDGYQTEYTTIGGYQVPTKCLYDGAELINLIFLLAVILFLV